MSGRFPGVQVHREHPIVIMNIEPYPCGTTPHREATGKAPAPVLMALKALSFDSDFFNTY
jgi:hypothetical protein